MTSFDISRASTAPTRMILQHAPRWALLLVLCGGATHTVHAQTRTTPVSATTASQAGAWSLPEPSVLIEQVLSRIVAQDKPGAVAMNSYARRFVGRAETIDAVRRFTGHSVDLAPSAFSAVSGWTDARSLELPTCEGPECPPPANSVWLAVTRIERGEVAREVFVWYTTNFAAYSEAGAQKAKYAFCERWVRAGGRWSYEGFIRVSSGGD